MLVLGLFLTKISIILSRIRYVKQLTMKTCTALLFVMVMGSSVDDFTTATDMGLMNSKTEGSRRQTALSCSP